MERRNFLRNAGLAIGTAIAAPNALAKSDLLNTPTASRVLDTWAKVRDDFMLDHHHIQMAQMLLASHPHPCAGSYRQTP